MNGFRNMKFIFLNSRDFAVIAGFVGNCSYFVLKFADPKSKLKLD